MSAARTSESAMFFTLDGRSSSPSARPARPVVYEVFGKKDEGFSRTWKKRRNVGQDDKLVVVKKKLTQMLARKKRDRPFSNRLFRSNVSCHCMYFGDFGDFGDVWGLQGKRRVGTRNDSLKPPIPGARENLGKREPLLSDKFCQKVPGESYCPNCRADLDTRHLLSPLLRKSSRFA